MPIDPVSASTAIALAPRPGTAPPTDPPTSSTTPLQPDSIHKSAPADPTKFYTGDSIHAALNDAAHTATATASAMAAGASGAIERAGPTLEELGSKAVGVARSMARAAAPIAGTALGAAAYVLATTAPAGETPDQLVHALTIDAAGRQHLASTAHSTETERRQTTFPDQGVDSRPNHTAHPA